MLVLSGHFLSFKTKRSSTRVSLLPPIHFPRHRPTLMSTYSSLYDKMHDPQILLTFKGSISFDMVNAMLVTLEPKLHRLEDDLPTRKRLYNILVECLQNIVHHSADIADDAEEVRNLGTVLMVTSEGDMYNVQTGNTILNRNVDRLKEIIEEINSLTPDELKESYKQTLDNAQFTSKGTAGLGFIDIARKSGQKLNYEFKRINDQYSIFSFSTSVPKKKK